VANFSWNVESDDDSAAVTAAAPAPTDALPSRRELRQRETASPVKRARKAGTRTASAEPHIPASRAVSSGRTSLGASQRAARGTASRRPGSPRPVSVRSAGSNRGGRLLRKFITIGAMFGAASLLVATSFPVVALRGNSASAITPVVSTSSRTGAQTLDVAAGAIEASTARDPYTVVSTIQRSRMKLGIQWPFPAPVPISSGFGARLSPCGGCSSYHEGVDFIPGVGTPIGAIADGTVTYAGYDSGFGYHVIVDHNINGQKVQSLYAHMLAGSIRVSVGQQVTVTQELGQVGNTGHSTGAHLHLEIHLDGTPIDPFAWLKANAN
jgi:murein DD-endopeptidase MepM/ murein hydrolase activator NlpD